MAKNIIFEDFYTLRVAVTSPASPKSGDAVMFGDRAGVALTDMDPATGRTTVQFEGVAEVSAKAIDGSGNNGIKDGDVLYFTAGDSPAVSKKATGLRYGVATSKPTDTAGGSLVTAGSTGTIRVFFGV
jgi:predicted RecA/RadA family phage recombinase